MNDRDTTQGVDGAESSRSARELLDSYGLDEEMVVHSLVYGWFGFEAVVEILCDAIDAGGSFNIDDFEEFLADNHPTTGEDSVAPP